MHIEIIKASITDPVLNVHAIVNAGNPEVRSGSGVSGALREACGPTFQAECLERLEEEYGEPLAAGDCLVTSAGAMTHVRWVLHVPSVDYRMPDPETGGPTGPARVRACLVSVFAAAVEVAAANNLTGQFSIAIAPLGARAGRLGVGQSLALIAEALENVDRATRDAIDRVVVVAFDDETKRVARLALHSIMTDSKRALEWAEARKPDARVTLVDLAIERVVATASIVDIGCGSQPYVGYRLLERGYAGHVTFVDWRDDALLTHETLLRMIAAQDGITVPPSWTWLNESAYAARLHDAVLIIQDTLPRWLVDGQVVMPNGEAHGVALLRELQATGARTLIAYASTAERDTLLSGAHVLGWHAEEIDDVASAAWKPQPVNGHAVVIALGQRRVEPRGQTSTPP